MQILFQCPLEDYAPFPCLEQGLRAYRFGRFPEFDELTMFLNSDVPQKYQQSRVLLKYYFRMAVLLIYRGGQAMYSGMRISHQDLIRLLKLVALSKGSFDSRQFGQGS